MATYYWVGGTGTWDASSTANWALTSGGLPGVAAPNSADTVIFDSASGTGTCTTASGSACAIATLNSATLGLTLGANHTMSGTFTLTLGALSLGNSTLTCSTFSSNNANVRSIAFGTGQITLTGSGSNLFNTDTATNFSFTGTSLVEIVYAGSSSVSITGGQTALGGTEANAINFKFSAGSYPLTVNSGRVYRSITFTSGYSGTVTFQTITVFGDLTLAANLTTASVANAITFAATSGIQKITSSGKTINQPITQNGGVGNTVQLQDNLTMGSTRQFALLVGTLDLNNLTLSCGIFSSSASTTRSIAFGTGNITLTGNNTNIWVSTTSTNFSYTGTPNVNCTYSGSVGNRIVFGLGTEARALNFNITAGSDAFFFQGGFFQKNIDFTGFSGSCDFQGTNIVGNLTISTGMTLASSASAIGLVATSGTQQITTNGKTLDFPVTQNGVGGSVQLQDNLTMGSTRTYVLTNGALDLTGNSGNWTLTAGLFQTTNSNVRSIAFGTGNITV